MVRNLQWALLALAVLSLPAPASEQEEADTSGVFYQEYLNRLMEDLRLSQIQDLAREWGVGVTGIRALRMNRSFWEERLSLNLSMGFPVSSGLQSLSIEYRLLPRLTMRGEVSRRAVRSEAWLDFIFHTEY